MDKSDHKVISTKEEKTQAVLDAQFGFARLDPTSVEGYLLVTAVKSGEDTEDTEGFNIKCEIGGPPRMQKVMLGTLINALRKLQLRNEEDDSLLG
jgi:hypothetical protein